MKYDGSSNQKENRDLQEILNIVQKLEANLNTPCVHMAIDLGER
jgi:hypothetical protein